MSDLQFPAPALLQLPHPSASVQLVPPPSIAVDVEFNRFKNTVTGHQIALAVARGKHHFPPVPNTELAVVKGKIKMRTAAAAKCLELMAKAREPSLPT